MTPTTKVVFRHELNRLYQLALQSGWMSFHMADAAQVPRSTLMRWRRGEAAPLTPADRDRVLTDICNKLKLRPI
jgi:hypothetical protein